jgi:trehalose 6-phosphate phosphatase
MTLPSALDHLPRLFGAPENGNEDSRAVPDRLRRLRPALFLDYDGTLTPIVERPEDAVIPEATREVVRRLAERFPVVVVSGRGRDDVARLVGLPDLVYAGSHGFDIQGPIQGPEGSADRLRHEPAREAEPVIQEVARALEHRLSEVPGTQVEPKRYTVAVHYRRVPADRVAAVEAAVDAELAVHPELRKGGGKKVWELRPDLDWDKGRAVLWLLRALGLANPSRNRSGESAGSLEFIPIYIGDDVTDEDAFRALAERPGGLEDGPCRGRGGIGVLVSEEERETAARYRLRDPDEVRELLERLADLPERQHDANARTTGDP